MGSAVEFPARSEDPAVVLAYQSASSWVVIPCYQIGSYVSGKQGKKQHDDSDYLTTCDSDFAGIVNVHSSAL